MGRRPIGDQPMSAAERMRRMRAARRQPVMSVEEFEAERQRLQEAYGDPDNDTELLAKRDQAFAELNGKVPRDEATSAEMASSLFTVRGADYCHELVEQLLTVLHWDQSGRPDAFPYVVKRMERQETFPPTYCMARLWLFVLAMIRRILPMILRLLLGYDCPERWLLAAVAGGAVMAICTTLVLRSAPAGVIVGVITYAVVVVWRSRRWCYFGRAVSIAVVLLSNRLGGQR